MTLPPFVQFQSPPRRRFREDGGKERATSSSGDASANVDNVVGHVENPKE